jgi:hypothetical protein
MSLSQGYPSTFSNTQQTQEVLKNHENEVKKIYVDINDLMAANGHSHTGNGSDGAVIGFPTITVDQTIATPPSNTGDAAKLLSWIVKDILNSKGNPANWYTSTYVWGQAYTSTLVISALYNKVSAVTEIPRNIRLTRIAIICRNSDNAPQAPTSAVTLTLYKTTSGTRTSILTKTFTVADSSDSTISINLAINDLLDYSINAANGLTGTVNVSLRGINR